MLSITSTHAAGYQQEKNQSHNREHGFSGQPEQQNKHACRHASCTLQECRYVDMHIDKMVEVIEMAAPQKFSRKKINRGI